MEKHEYVPLKGDVGTWCGYTDGAMTCGMSATADVHQVNATQNPSIPSSRLRPTPALVEEVSRACGYEATRYFDELYLASSKDRAEGHGFTSAGADPLELAARFDGIIAALLRQREGGSVSQDEESLSPASLACTECPYVFTEAEVAAEDKNIWGHPCPGDKQPGMRCESYRATVSSQPSPNSESPAIPCPTCNCDGTIEGRATTQRIAEPEQEQGQWLEQLRAAVDEADNNGFMRGVQRCIAKGREMANEWKQHADAAPIGTFENERWPFLKMRDAANEVVTALESLPPVSESQSALVEAARYALGCLEPISKLGHLPQGGESSGNWLHVQDATFVLREALDLLQNQDQKNPVR